MNLLARAKMSSHLIFSSPSPVRRLCNLHPETASLRHCDFYSTQTTTRNIQKTQQLTKLKTQKSSGPSSTTFSQRVRKQTEALNTVWPKPGEIPFQAKVANFVNLIGRVQLPVRFESDSDGKHFATSVISLVNGGERNSLMIPLVFEGDLAHVVSCHVKENDCVFVSGQLSVDPMRLVLSENLGKLHVVVENINFIDGFKNLNVSDKKVGVSLPGAKIDKFCKNGAKVFDEMPETVDDDDDEIDAVLGPPVAALKRDNYESKLEKNDEKNEKSVVKKNADQIMDLWRDLVKNPLQWWDFRDHKMNGLVKEKYPDFKQKVTGEALWISSAPKWVLPGIGKLEFDVMDIKPKQVMDVKVDDSWKNLKQVKDFKVDDSWKNLKQVKDVKVDESWKNLVENPGNWWDNRTKKKYPKSPDFKHKETGEALWLNGSPDWVSSRLPPMQN